VNRFSFVVFISFSQCTRIRQKEETPLSGSLFSIVTWTVLLGNTCGYHGGVVMLSYLANSIKPEIQMAVHQTAHFSIKPMRSHELAIMRIGRHLCNNHEGGIIYKVDRTKGLEVYADTNFAGGLSTADSENADCVLSRTCFVIC